MRIKDLLDVVFELDEIEVDIMECCPPDFWYVKIYEGFASEFKCELYNLSHYHVACIFTNVKGIMVIYLEED